MLSPGHHLVVIGEDTISDMFIMFTGCDYSKFIPNVNVPVLYAMVM